MKQRIGGGLAEQWSWSWPDSNGMRLREKVGEVWEGGGAAKERGQSRHLNGRIIFENAFRNIIFIVGFVQKFPFHILVFWDEILVEWWKG